MGQWADASGCAAVAADRLVESRLVNVTNIPSGTPVGYRIELDIQNAQAWLD
jgi:hypothetical protein